MFYPHIWAYGPRTEKASLRSGLNVYYCFEHNTRSDTVVTFNLNNNKDV